MLSLVAGLLLAAVPLPPKPVHYVTDRPVVLDVYRADKLNEKLKEFERQTSDQVIVYIDTRVPDGTTLEEMSAQAMHEWGIGQKGKDNGVILFLFTADHKMRIEVGYGLEASLTDAKSKRITSTIMKPRLQAGDTTGAVEQGVDAILKTIRGEPFQGTGSTAAEGKVVHVGFTGTMIILIGILLLAAFMLIAAVTMFVRTFRRNRWAAFFGSWATSGSSGSDSSSSDGGSGGDFSGGGGDGGGGGASDSW